MASAALKQRMRKATPGRRKSAKRATGLPTLAQLKEKLASKSSSVAKAEANAAKLIGRPRI